MQPPAPDPFGFDQIEVETWGDILGPQAVDLALLAAFIAFALYGFRRRSEPLKYATLVLAILYMGFAKSYLISITNVFSLVDWSFPVVKYNLAWYLFASFTLASTVLWGRLYCGRICAYGALTQVMDRLLPSRWRLEVPRPIERRAAWIKFAVLAGVMAYFIATRNMLVYQYVEPFWMFGLFGSTPLWIGLGVLLLATVFVRNLYCRFLCPVGATLGLISTLTVFRIKRWSECGTCKICQKACEWGAIDGPKILVTECVRCDDCEHLYADEAKCPHWRILAYQARKVIPLVPTR
jgi:NosR/NirI family transcriptional regulator, nitrous oxide reductase regulator